MTRRSYLRELLQSLTGAEWRIGAWMAAQSDGLGRLGHWPMVMAPGRRSGRRSVTLTNGNHGLSSWRRSELSLWAATLTVRVVADENRCGH